METLYDRLQQLKQHHHRLQPDRRLATLDEAKAFVDEVGIATLTPGNELPSVFAAVQGQPYKAESRGFGSYPRDQWWWGGALAESQNILQLKILSGKGLFVAKRLWPPLDSIIREVMGRLDQAAAGPRSLAPEARYILDYLRSHGPTRTDVLRRELGFKTSSRGRQFRRAKEQLESLGVILGRQAKGLNTHIHVNILTLWDQRFPRPISHSQHALTKEVYQEGLADLLRAAVHAAVIVQETTALRWFVWSREHQAEALEGLVSSGRFHSLKHEGVVLLATAEWVDIAV
ncbi:MAG: hypothetical protein ACE5KH_01850 [Candidatus Geothermarchaeales archaeon]